MSDEKKIYGCAKCGGLTACWCDRLPVPEYIEPKLNPITEYQLRDILGLEPWQALPKEYEGGFSIVLPPRE